MFFDGLNNLVRGSPRKHFCQVILKSVQLFLTKIFKVFYIDIYGKQEAHRPQLAHLSETATADMQMLCNIFPILSLQLMKGSSFEQFLVLKKKKNVFGFFFIIIISPYMGMTVNGA